MLGRARGIGSVSSDVGSGQRTKRRELRLHLLAALGFLFLLAVIFGDILFSSESIIPSHAQGDGARYFLFMRLFGYSELRGGQMPLWNPYTFSGMPFVGNFQSAMYYPPNLLHLLTTVRVGLVLEFVVALFVLGMTSFAWLRHKAISGLACFMGAVTILFASTVTLRVLAGQYSVLGTFAWWPLLLLAIDVLERRRSLGWTLVGIGALTFMILAGHPPTVLQAGLATSVYVLAGLLRAPAPLAWLVRLAPIVLVPPVLAAVQLFEGLSTASEGLRRAGMSYEFAVSHSFPPEQLLTLLSPDLFGNADRFNLTYFGRVFYWDATFFVGLGGLLLATHGALEGPADQRRRALVLCVLLVVIAMGGYTPFYLLLYHGLPGFEFARAPSKFLFFASVCVGWLAALGTERLLVSRAGLRRLVFVAGGLAAFAAGLSVWALVSPVSLVDGVGPMAVLGRLTGSADFVVEGVAEDWHVRLVRSGVIACAMATVLGTSLWAARSRRAAVFVVLCLTLVELTVFARVGRGRTRMAIEMGLRPDAVQTYSIAGDERVHETAAPSNVAMSRRNFAIWGYDPVILGRYIEFMVWSQGLDWRDVRKPTFFVPYKTHPLHAMLRTRYRLDWKTGKREKLDGAWPRFVFVDDYDVVGYDEVLGRMAAPDFDARRTVILEEEPVPAPVPGSLAQARPRARVLAETTDRIDVSVELERPAILLVTDAYSRGWRARSLDEPSRDDYAVLAGNHVLRAVPLDRGSHRIRLEYAPTAHRVGEWVSAVGLGGYCVAWGVFAIRRRRGR